MREDLLSILRCPSCRSEKTMSGEYSRTHHDELWDGELRCLNCRESFPMAAGVPDLVRDPSETILKERSSYARSKVEVFERIEELNLNERNAELFRIASMKHTGEEFLATSRINVHGMLSLINPLPGTLMLELGAGSGWLTCSWAKRSIRCVATDISADLKLELSPLLMNHHHVYFERALADMTDLPFASVFDFVFVSASLHHADDLTASLKEAARVLKPEGNLVIINEPMHGLLRRSGKRFIDQAAEENPDVHEQSFNAFQWWHALRCAGLKARFYFPPYYAELLESSPQSHESSPRLKSFARRLWRSPLRSVILSGSTMKVLQLIFGINVCLIAQKRGRHTS